MQAQGALESLLLFFDQLHAVRQLEGSARASSTKITQLQERLPKLRGQVFQHLPMLAAGKEGNSLSDADLLVLGIFFHARLDGKHKRLRGSDLVARLALAGIPRTEALAAVVPNSLLRQGPWLTFTCDEGQFDPLDAWVDVRPAALELFQAEATTLISLAAEEPRRPYRNEEELLWELHAWRKLCMKRAEVLLECGGESTRVHEIRRQARRKLFSIRSRLRSTPNGRELGVERFRREFGLGPDHVLIVVHLLFGEHLESEPFASGLECLHLVSETRNDLFRKRELFHSNSRLRRSGILSAEAPDLGKELTSTLSLADWATDQILSGVRGLPRILDVDLGRLEKGES